MKLTENAVLITDDGQLARVRKSDDPANPTSRKKIREIVSMVTGEVVKAKHLVVNSVDTIKTYIGAFFKLPVHERSGYDGYYSSVGFTNPETPRTLTNEGVLRLMSVLTTILHERIAAGGAEGASAGVTLDIFNAYHAVVGETIVLAEKESLLAKAAAMFTVAEISAPKNKVVIPQPATVTVEEAAD